MFLLTFLLLTIKFKFASYIRVYFDMLTSSCVSQVWGFGAGRCAADAGFIVGCAKATGQDGVWWYVR